MVAETRALKTRGWETWDRRWKVADWSKAKANPAAGMDSIPIKGRRCRAHVESPRFTAPKVSGSGKVCATVEIGRQVEEQKEAGQMEVGSQKINDLEDLVEPCKLCRKVNGGAGAIDTGDMGVPVKEPIKGWV